MSHAKLIWLSSMLALLGVGLLTVTAVFGNLLAEQITQKFKLTKGQTFKYHRLISTLGVVVLLLHPIPLVFAQETTGVSVASIFVPFLAEKKITIIAVGVLAMYALLVVLISSLYMKYLQQKIWRVLHYGSYLFFGLGFWHGLSISDSFEANSEVSWLDPKKIILEVEVVILLLLVVWRIAIRRSRQKTV